MPSIHTPVLLIEQNIDAFPSDLAGLLSANSQVQWNARDISSDRELLKLRKVEGVWQFELPRQSTSPRRSARQSKARVSPPALIDMVFPALLGTGRLQPSEVRSELLVKAVVGKKTVIGEQLAVVDATAGLGRDAVLLAAAKCKVTAIERNPLLAFLLQEAAGEFDISHSNNGEAVIGSVSFCCGNSVDYLSQMNNECIAPHVIYLDPMYQGDGSHSGGLHGNNVAPAPPGLKSTAAVKKHAQLLQYLDAIFFAGQAMDDCNREGGSMRDDSMRYDSMKESSDAVLLRQALQHARRKVVVKRAPRANWLDGQKPTSSIEGKAVRFDVYAC